MFLIESANKIRCEPISWLFVLAQILDTPINDGSNRNPCNGTSICCQINGMDPKIFPSTDEITNIHILVHINVFLE